MSWKSIVREFVPPIVIKMLRPPPADQPKTEEARLTVPDVPHEPINANATYAPWRLDHDFQEAFGLICEHTLVDIYRCYELWTFAGRTLPGNIIEVGVWRGGTGCLMARRAPTKTVYLCDTFSGVIGAGARDTYYKGGEHSDASIETVRELSTRMKLKNTRLLVGTFPKDTSAQIASEQFALAHIDVDVYESAKWCFEWIWPRIVPYGAVIFDDYGFYACVGVTRMVNEIRDPDALTVYNLNGHAIVLKLPQNPPIILAQH
jgi:O-methyltransferase